MKYKTITKEETKFEEIDGVQTEKAVDVDFVQETIIVEHKKDELIARLQMEIADDDTEIARRQAHKAQLEAELLELSTPSVK